MEPSRIYPVYGQPLSNSAVRALTCSADARFLYVAHYRSLPKTASIITGRQWIPSENALTVLRVDDFEPLFEIKSVVERISPMSDTSLVLTHHYNGGVSLFNTTLNRITDSVRDDRITPDLFPTAACSLNSRNLVVSGCKTGMVMVWDTETGRVSASHKLLTHIDHYNVNTPPYVHSLSSSPKVLRFAACGRKCYGIVVASYDQETSAFTDISRIYDESDFVSMSPCGNYVLSHWNSSARIYASDGSLIKRLPETGTVNDASWTETSSLLFVATDSASVQVWSVPEFTLLAELSTGICDSRKGLTMQSVTVNPSIPAVYAGDSLARIFEWRENAIPQSITDRWN